jgi:hypothetical protein
LEFVIVNPLPMVTVKLAVAVLLAESFTCTPKVAEPRVGLEPETTPPVDKLSPTADNWVAPEVTLHVYPEPDPPLAARASEYADPAKPLGSGLVVVTFKAALTVTLKFPLATLLAESFTCTVKLAVPATGVVPESKPPPDRVNPTADNWLAPALTLHTWPLPDPPVAANCCEYATPAYPTVSGDVVVIEIPALIVTLNVAVAVLLAESFTCTVKVAVPATGELPVSTPPLDRLSPTVVSWLAPVVTVQVYPELEPPCAASVSLYAVPE